MTCFIFPPFSHSLFSSKAFPRFGRTSATSNLHYQTQIEQLSLSSSIASQDSQFGSISPASRRSANEGTHGDAAIVNYASTSGNFVYEANNERTVLPSSNGNVPGLIQDVSKVWLQTLADLCDWRSKQERGQTQLGSTDHVGPSAPSQSNICFPDRPEHSMLNNAVSRKPVTMVTSASSPPVNHMVSTILAGSVSSTSHHDAVVSSSIQQTTGIGEPKRKRLSEEMGFRVIQKGMSRSKSDEQIRVFGHNSGSDSTGSSPSVGENVHDSSLNGLGEIPHTKLFNKPGPNSKDTDNSNHGNGCVPMQPNVQGPGGGSGGIAGVPVKNLPPRKRHMRSLVHTNDAETHLTTPNYDPSTCPYPPGLNNLSLADKKPDETVRDEGSNVYLDESSTDTESVIDVVTVTAGEPLKRKEQCTPPEVTHTVKKRAGEKTTSGSLATNSPLSLESLTSSNSVCSSNVGSPFSSNRTSPDSGNSSRNGDIGPGDSSSQPLADLSVPHQFPIPDRVLDTNSNGLRPQLGSVRSQLIVHHTTHYNLTQEISARPNIPRLPIQTHIPPHIPPLPPMNAVFPTHTTIPPTQMNYAGVTDQSCISANIAPPVCPPQTAWNMPAKPTPQVIPSVNLSQPDELVNGLNSPQYHQGGVQGQTPLTDPSLLAPQFPADTFQGHSQQQNLQSTQYPPTSLAQYHRLRAQNILPAVSNSQITPMWLSPSITATQNHVATNSNGAPPASLVPPPPLPSPLSGPGHIPPTPALAAPSPPVTTTEYAPLKRAPGRSRYNNHLSSNKPLGDTNFLCEVCNKVFPLQRLLNRHMKCHSATKRYNCAFCGKGFNDTFDLKRHVRTHTGVRPYKCEKCGKAFTQRCSLESHLSKVHSEQHSYTYKQRRTKIFVCEECGHTTDTADSHYEHIKALHPDSTELRKYQDKLQFQKLVMQQEGESEDGVFSATAELLYFRGDDERSSSHALGRDSPAGSNSSCATSRDGTTSTQEHAQSLSETSTGVIPENSQRGAIHNTA